MEKDFNYLKKLLLSLPTLTGIKVKKRKKGTFLFRLKAVGLGGMMGMGGTPRRSKRIKAMNQEEENEAGSLNEDLKAMLQEEEEGENTEEKHELRGREEEEDQNEMFGSNTRHQHTELANILMNLDSIAALIDHYQTLDAPHQSKEKVAENLKESLQEEWLEIQTSTTEEEQTMIYEEIKDLMDLVDSTCGLPAECLSAAVRFLFHSLLEAKTEIGELKSERKTTKEETEEREKLVAKLMKQYKANREKLKKFETSIDGVEMHEGCAADRPADRPKPNVSFGFAKPTKRRAAPAEHAIDEEEEDQPPTKKQKVSDQMVEMVTGKKDASKISGDERKLWNQEIDSWNKDLKLPRGSSPEMATMHYLLSYSRLVKTLNPTAALALQKLQLILNRSGESRVAKLQGVITDMASKRNWENCNWKETFSEIVKLSLPSDYDNYLQNSRKNVPFENSYQYCNKINEFNELLELMDIPRPSDRDMIQTMQTAMGAAVRLGKLPKTLVESFVTESANKTFEETTTIIRKLEEVHAKTNNLTNTNSTMDRPVGQAGSERGQGGLSVGSQRGRGDRLTSSVTCNYCGKLGHKEKGCRQKLFGKLCPKGCGGRSKDFTKHRCKPRVPAQAQRIMYEEVECKLIQTLQQNELPILTGTTIKTEGTPLDVWMFLDPGSGKTLVEAGFFNAYLKNSARRVWNTKRYKITGVDSSSEGITCDHVVELTFILPNGKEIKQECLVVKNLPEPVLLGRDWGAKAGAHVLMDQKKCVSTQGGFDEPWMKKAKYDQWLKYKELEAIQHIRKQMEEGRRTQSKYVRGLSKEEAEEKIFE